jgi:DNA-binding response OmpR family regulator
LEDDVLLAMDVEDFLIGQGFHGAGAVRTLLAQALEALKASPPDGAIVDLNLNGELSFSGH